MYDGMINVRKEKGFTSHDVVAKLRGILHQKKIGHTGTLDPDAVGVLPVCLGKGTKLCDMITDREKTYEAVMLLGKTTDTQDISGQVLTECDVNVSEDAVWEACESFVGDYMQIPPMYSALKVNGQKLYELARAGKEVERKARLVVIHSLTLKEVALPYVTMEVCCSKGTYIRTLCRDIGEKLGCGACMAELTRTKVGRFDIADAWTLAEIEAMAKQGEEVLGRHVVTLEEMLADHEAVRTVDAMGDKMLRNGNHLGMDQIVFCDHQDQADRDGRSADGMMMGGCKKFSDGQQLRVYTSENVLMAVYSYDPASNSLKNVKMFV